MLEKNRLGSMKGSGTVEGKEEEERESCNSHVKPNVLIAD
jgi:hypothetical protein